DPNPGQAGVFLLGDRPVIPPEIVERRPGLPLPGHILALVFADRTALGGTLGLRVLHAAGGADIAGHASPSRGPVLRAINPPARPGSASSSKREGVFQPARTESCPFSPVRPTPPFECIGEIGVGSGISDGRIPPRNSRKGPLNRPTTGPM